EQHDRLAAARHLNRARRDAVGGDVESAAMRDLPAGETHSHAVGARPDGVFTVEEGRHFSLWEMIELGSFDHADTGPRLEHETFKANFATRTGLRLAERQTVAGGE